MGGWVIFWILFGITALCVLDMGHTKHKHE